MKGVQGLWKSLPRWKTIVVVHLIGLNKFYTLFEYFYDRLTKSKSMSSIVLAVFQCRYPHIFIMLPYFKKIEVLFSRKLQGAIRAEWKIYPCIFYHFSTYIFPITIFQVATSPLTFSTTRPSLAQCRKQMNVFMYSPILIQT